MATHGTPRQTVARCSNATRAGIPHARTTPETGPHTGADSGTAPGPDTGTDTPPPASRTTPAPGPAPEPDAATPGSGAVRTPAPAPPPAPAPAPAPAPGSDTTPAPVPVPVPVSTPAPAPGKGPRPASGSPAVRPARRTLALGAVLGLLATASLICVALGIHQMLDHSPLANGFLALAGVCMTGVAAGVPLFLHLRRKDPSDGGS
ncbi:hypothetical protein [Streptomyces sp. NPDC001381]|uniref:hypothetical protein n=1 Tax=Streptomyces sp. NPDC001381 TaxID=3364567 RepID=UPI0036796831